MRGTPEVVYFHGLIVGLIPTYAGNTVLFVDFTCHVRAHPHVCGEHGIFGVIRRFRRGSSPRMRGTLAFHRLFAAWVGLIPTYAGNTGVSTSLSGTPRAHPHVCGEHAHYFVSSLSPVGSSPRMRGTHLLTWGFIPTHQVLELVWSPKPVLTLHDF